MDEQGNGFTPEELVEQQLFRSVDMAAVAPLLRACPVRMVDAGDVLLRAGEPNDRLYLVLAGRLSVRLGTLGNAPLTFIGPGESVGEMSLIDHQPASAFVVAEATSRLLVLDEELVWMLVNTSHAISSNLLFTLARRLRYGNDVIFEDREQLREYRFHATVDALTGLFNRYWLNTMLPRQIDRSEKNDEPLSVLMIDIDHFKSFNDEYGHLAGDHAICAVATSLREHLRPSDMAARFGGEEFVVLLPNSNRDAARIVAERLRLAVERTRLSFPHGPEIGGLTISLGIAQMTEDTATENALIGAADAALYEAKNGGRNRVVG